MMDDALLKEAEKAIELSALAEVEIVHAKGHSLLLAILAKAKEEAQYALRAMIDVDPTKTELVRELQGRARRYADLARFVREIVNEGIEAQQRLDPDEQQDIQEAVGFGPRSMEMLRAHGYTPSGED